MKNKCHIGYKTLWEKKILVTSNFSFSQNVFYSYISSVRQNGALCGNGFKKKALENTVGEGETNVCQNVNLAFHGVENIAK